jgi:murein L,D-transpeptidase YafK
LSANFAPRLPTRRLFCAGLGIIATGIAAPPIAARAERSSESEQADRILVLKSKRKLLLLRGDTVVASFVAALGAHPIGPKQFAGDQRTPEGLYEIDAMNPYSRFHLALRISYPNAEDELRARLAGRSPGGDIEIHGMPGGYGHFDPAAGVKDWTNGCIAVGNRAIEQIWSRVTVGTPVEIRG